MLHRLHSKPVQFYEFPSNCAVILPSSLQAITVTYVPKWGPRLRCFTQTVPIIVYTILCSVTTSPTFPPGGACILGRIAEWHDAITPAYSRALYLILPGGTNGHYPVNDDLIMLAAINPGEIFAGPRSSDPTFISAWC